ncbi:uncharacterized protein B0J16DRAFT_355286 [Fusarium flagelliforme]|uniref:uncharacterized protein n=1 Tax=Fusarium flagelliforme TaxID=2675880 RepID=UPI001E8D59A9|nr:uncharacterized protein B0J16DRAFT_355286 [Fusarium flagelliforme]KAH7184576.1 hypothetical protein B0J16DRAFT_355286 [Fusarium flagelliforme]
MVSTAVESIELSRDDIVIAVMGVTGAGKSTFINQVTGENVGIGHGLTSHTIGRCVYLVDTPGFDDTSRNDTEILKEIAFFFSQIYQKNVQLAGIIYLHRISDNRLSGTALKNLDMFKQLCGKNAFGHVVLCTSMWDNLDTALPNVGDQREKELIDRSEFWGAMHTGGSQVVRWLGTKDSAKSVVDKIIKIHKGNGKAMLKIQQELVDKGMSLDKTGAGREVQRELLAAKAELQQEIQQLQNAHAEMMRQSDQELASKLASQKEAFEKRLVETSEAQEELKISLEVLMEQKEAEYEQRLAAAVSEQQKLTAALEEKAAEYARTRREQMEDEESFKEAQEHFATEVENLKKKIKDQESLMEQRRLEQELKEADELKAELEKQRIDEEKAAAMHEEKLRIQLQKKARRKEKMRDGVAILGVVAGVVSAVVGVATMNPGLIAMGASMAGGSASG